MWKNVLKITSKKRTLITRKNTLFSLFTCVAFVLFFVLATRTRAATRTWDGGGANNNWSTCANWSSDICPVAGDSVIFDGTSTKDSVIDASAPASVASIAMNAGYTGTLSLSRTFNVTTSYSQAAGSFNGGSSTLTTASYSLSGGVFTATSGNWTVPGAFTVTGGTFNHNSGTVTFSSNIATLSCNNITFNLVSFTGQTSTKTISSNCSLPVGNNPTIPDNFVLNGTISGTGTLTSNGLKTINTGASLSGFSAIAGNGGLTVAGATLDFSAYSSYATGAVTVSSGSLSLPATATMGSLTLSGGTFTAGSTNTTITAALTVTGSAVFNHNNGTFTFANSSSVTHACNNIVFNRVAITMTGNGGGTFNSACSLPLGSNPTVQMGTSNTNSVTFQGAVSGSGTLNVTGTTGGNPVIFSATSSLTGFSGYTGSGITTAITLNLSSFTTFAINGPVSISAGTTTFPAPTGSITLTGVTVTGGTFVASPGSMSLTGNFSVTGAGAFNANGGSVLITGGNSQTLTCNSPFNSVTITKTGNAGLTVGSGCTLPLGNNPTIQNGTISTGPLNLNGVLSGTGTLTLTAASNSNGLVISSTGSLSGFTGLNANALTISGATANYSSFSPFTISGSVSVTSGSLSLPTSSSIGGSLTVSGGTFTAPSDNLPIAGSINIGASGTFNANGGSLTISSNSPSFTCNNAVFNLIVLNFTGTATVNSGCTLPLGNNPTISSAVTLSGTLSGTGTITQTTGQMNMQATGALSGFTGLTGTTNSLRLNGTNQSFAGYTTLNLPEGFTINSSGVFTAPSGTMTVGAGFDISPGTFNANGGTVNFYGGTATINCNNQTFNLVTFTGQTGVKTINSNCSLPLGANPTIPFALTLAGTLSGSGTITFTNGTTTLNAGAALSGFTGLTGTTNALTVSGATVDFTGYTPFNVAGQIALSSGSLTLPAGANLGSNLSITGGTLGTTNGDITVNGNLTVGTSTMNAPTGTLTVTGTVTFSGTNTFNANGGTINFTGTNRIITCNNITLNRVTLNHTSGITLGSTCAIPLGNNPVIADTVSLSGSLSGTGTLTATTGTVTMNSGSSISGFSGMNLNGFSVAGPTVNLSSYASFAASGTVTVSSGSLALPSGATMGNLTLSGGTLNTTTGDLTISGMVSIGTGSVLNAPTGNLNIGGTFAHTAGTFTHNSGTVILNGGDQAITGTATTFNNLSKILTAPTPQTLTFPNGIVETVSGTLTLQGYDESARLLLRSSSTGNQWRINPTGSRDILFLDVRDGWNTSATPIEMGGTGSIDSTNNTNFNFNSLTPNDPSSLGPSNVISAIIVPTIRPTFSFTLSDPNPLDTMRYQIQISQNSDFSSPVVDYTSGLISQGTKSFTVGQSAGTGTYTVGAQNQSLATGNYYWRVRATDNSGLQSNYTAGNGGSMAFIIDADPPAAFTPALDVTSPTTNQTPILTFSTTDNVAVDHYRVKIDGSSFITQTSPYQLPTLSEGAHTITVRAYDTSNNTTDGVVNVTVDLSQPNSFTPTLDVTSPTTNQTPTVSFTTTDNDGIDHYEVKVDSGSFSTQTSPYLLPTLSEGAHTITVRAFDTAGNTRDGSVNVTIDLTPPANFTPTLNVTSPTTDTQPIVSFSTTDANGISHYEVQVDAGGYTTQTSPYQVPTLSIGDHTIFVRAIDNAGNVRSTSVAITVESASDTPPAAFTPTLNVTSPTNTQTPTLSFSTTDDVGIDHYEVKIDGGAFTTQTSPYLLPTLSEGAHTITVRAFDTANQTTDGTVNVTVDITAPAAFTPSFVQTSPTNDNTPTVTFATTDNLGIDYYQVKVDAGAFSTHSSAYTLPGQLDGEHTVTVRAYDDAGNFTDGQATITINTTAPASFTPTLNVTSPTSDTQPIVSFSTTDDLGIDHYAVRVDAGSFTTQTSPYQLPVLSQGAHTITVRAYDLAGNTRDGSVNVTIDVNPPDAFTPTLNVTSPTNNTTPTVSFSTTDDGAIDHYEVKVDSGAFTPQTSPYQLPALSQGAHTITVRAFDDVGNTTDGSVNVTIDTTSPSLNVNAPKKTSNVDITNTTVGISDANGVLVSNVSVTGAVKNCTQNSAISISCTLTISSSGDVDVSATDAAGNVSSTTITGYVIETVAPEITITAPTKTSVSAITDTTIVVTDNYAVTAANVEAISGGSISCAQTSTTRVDCTATITSSGDLVINALDDASNADAATEAGYNITNTPPLSFTPTLNTPATTSNRTPILFFSTTDSDGINRYEVKIDSGAFSVQVSPYQLPSLSDGLHTITVRALTSWATLPMERSASPSIRVRQMLRHHQLHLRLLRRLSLHLPHQHRHHHQLRHRHLSLHPHHHLLHRHQVRQPLRMQVQRSLQFHDVV
jgi:hypothetical protein